MYTRHTLAAGALALVAAFPSIAADKADDVIVVTATRIPTRENELMADVSVISREEIEQAGQTTIEQLLARQPGIQYTANGGPGTSSGLFIRGASLKQSIILVDGIRIGSATTGEAALSRLPLSQIDRIEILRGPASSLYGADAVGGVIQVFTRHGEGPARVNGSTGYGTYGTSDTTLGVSGGTDNTSYSLQGAYYNTNGFNAITNPRNSYYNPDRDGFHNGSFTGSFSVRPAQGHEIGINLFSSSGTSKYDSSPKSKDYKNEQDLSSYSIYSRNTLNSIWTSTVRLGTSTDDSKQYANNTRSSAIKTDQDQASWQNDIKLPIGTALVAIEYLKQKVSGTTNYSISERTINSALVGWTGSVGNNRFQLNLRRDDNSQYGGETTGSATYGYQFTTAWRAHISYGTAFRAPTFNELYWPNYGNPNLAPEKSKNTEAGINWEQGNHRASAVVYNNDVTDLIQNGPAPGYAPSNIAKALLRGATLNYDGRFAEWATGVTLDFLTPRNEENGANNGNRLARRAEQQMSSYVSRNMGNWDLRAEWQLIGDRYNDPANKVKMGGYGLVNLYADYKLQKDWALFARANNIFDKEYETITDYATAGANFFVGIRYAPK